MLYRFINPGRVLYADGGSRKKHVYRIKNPIKCDMYRVYYNRKTATYNLYALGSSIPRQSESFDDIIRIMHALVKYKREKLPGAFGGVNNAGY